MKVNIDITNKIYDFIDPATGEKFSPEDFAKKYPGVGVGGYRPSIQTTTGAEEIKKSQTE